MSIVQKLFVVPDCLSKLKPWNSRFKSYRNKDFLNVLWHRKMYYSKKANDQSGQRDSDKRSALVAPCNTETYDTKPNCPKKLNKNLNGGAVNKKMTNENKSSILLIEKKNYGKNQKKLPAKVKCVQKKESAKVEKRETKAEKKACFTAKAAVSKNKTFKAVSACKPTNSLFQAVAPKSEKNAFKAVCPEKVEGKAKIDFKAICGSKIECEDVLCAKKMANMKSVGKVSSKEILSSQCPHIEEDSIPKRADVSKCGPAIAKKKAKSETAIGGKGKETKRAQSKVDSLPASKDAKSVLRKSGSSGKKLTSKCSKTARKSKSEPNLARDKTAAKKSTEVKECKSSQSIKTSKSIERPAKKVSRSTQTSKKDLTKKPCSLKMEAKTKPNLKSKALESSQAQKSTKTEAVKSNPQNQASNASISKTINLEKLKKETKPICDSENATPKIEKPEKSQEIAQKTSFVKTKCEKSTSAAKAIPTKTNSICDEKKPLDSHKETVSATSNEKLKAVDTKATSATQTCEKSSPTAQAKPQKTNSICDETKPVDSRKETVSATSNEKLKAVDTKATSAPPTCQKSSQTDEVKASKSSIRIEKKSRRTSKKTSSASISSTKTSTDKATSDKADLATQTKGTKSSLCEESKSAKNVVESKSQKSTATAQAEASSTSVCSKTKPADSPESTKSTAVREADETSKAQKDFSKCNKAKKSKSESALKTVKSAEVQESASAPSMSLSSKMCAPKTNLAKNHKPQEDATKMSSGAIEQPVANDKCGRPDTFKFDPSLEISTTPCGGTTKPLETKPQKNDEIKSSTTKTEEKTQPTNTTYKNISKINKANKSKDLKSSASSSALNCGRYTRADQIKPIKGSKPIPPKSLKSPQESVTKCANPGADKTPTPKKESEDTSAKKTAAAGGGSKPPCGKKAGSKAKGSGDKKAFSSKAKTYRNISLATILAVMGFCGYTFMSIEHKERAQFVPYEYLYRRNKRFPWGDGTKSYFHNAEVNALPTGYEEHEENVD